MHGSNLNARELPKIESRSLEFLISIEANYQILKIQVPGIWICLRVSLSEFPDFYIR